MNGHINWEYFSSFQKNSVSFEHLIVPNMHLRVLFSGGATNNLDSVPMAKSYRCGACARI